MLRAKLWQLKYRTSQEIRNLPGNTVPPRKYGTSHEIQNLPGKAEERRFVIYIALAALPADIFGITYFFTILRTFVYRLSTSMRSDIRMFSGIVASVPSSSRSFLVSI